VCGGEGAGEGDAEVECGGERGVLVYDGVLAEEDDLAAAEGGDVHGDVALGVAAFLDAEDAAEREGDGGGGGAEDGAHLSGALELGADG
jgi:hypothetical protein